MNQKVRDRGSVSVEMVALTPILVLLALFAVFVGRSAEGLTAVQHAADQGARAASKVAFPRMAAAGTDAVMADLVDREVACVSPRVSVVRGDDDRTVTVSVSCSPSTDGLSLLDVDSPRLSASSTEVVDFYRGGDE